MHTYLADAYGSVKQERAFHRVTHHARGGSQRPPQTSMGSAVWGFRNDAGRIRRKTVKKKAAKKRARENVIIAQSDRADDADLADAHGSAEQERTIHRVMRHTAKEDFQFPAQTYISALIGESRNDCGKDLKKNERDILSRISPNARKKTAKKGEGASSSPIIIIICKKMRTSLTSTAASNKKGTSAVGRATPPQGDSQRPLLLEHDIGFLETIVERI